VHQQGTHKEEVGAETRAGTGARTEACKAEVAEVSAQVSALLKRMDEADHLVAQLRAEIKQLKQKSQDNAEVYFYPCFISAPLHFPSASALMRQRKISYR